METLLTNKKFINASIVLVVVVSLFVIALFINEVKASPYAGYGTQTPPTISVSGKGDVMAVSDIATVSFSVSKDADTAAQAQSLLNVSVGKTVDYLKSQKIADKDIKSEYGGLNPKYSYGQATCLGYPCPPQRDPKIVGYSATQSITVKVRAVDTANDIRTGLATLGVTNISGPNFSIDNEDSFKDQARSIAIADAREKAEILARELHVHLGRIISFNENGSNQPPMMYEAKAMSGATSDASAPVLPKGENKIVSNVTILYEIK